MSIRFPICRKKPGWVVLLMEAMLRKNERGEMYYEHLYQHILSRSGLCNLGPTNLIKTWQVWQSTRALWIFYICCLLEEIVENHYIKHAW